MLNQDDDRTVVKRVVEEGTLRPGAVLSNTYSIEELLARGGMGEVYRARHIELGTEHAVKVILRDLAEDETIIRLFIEEARQLGRINNDAIVQYQGFLRNEQGSRFLVMEFVDGVSLASILRERRLEPPDVLALMRRVGLGLAAAHERGIVHRDVSPQNIILPGGKIEAAKLIDFGIAKSVDPGYLTLIGSNFAGKYSWVSPEQVGLYGGQVDQRSDIYSFGLVLAAAALGDSKKLDMGSSLATVIQTRQERPDLKEVPESLRSIIGWMLEPDPANRPPTIRAVIEASEQSRKLAGATAPAFRAWPPRVAWPPRRLGWLGAGIVALALLGIALTQSGVFDYASGGRSSRGPATASPAAATTKPGPDAPSPGLEPKTSPAPTPAPSEAKSQIPVEPPPVPLAPRPPIPASPATGTLALAVAPGNASLKLDGQLLGMANGSHKEISPGNHDVEIAADGYETRRESVVVEPGQERRLTIALALTPPPPPPPPPPKPARLQLEVATPAAMLKLDGQDMGPAAGFRKELAAGTYEVEVSAEGYTPQRRSVELRAGGEKSLSFELARIVPPPPPIPPAPTTGVLALVVSPAAAMVRVDGEPMGSAQGFRRELPRGQHEIEITADGFAPLRQKVDIAPGPEKSLSLTLLALPKAVEPPSEPPAALPAEPPIAEAPAPASSATLGLLMVMPEPNSAWVAVDGKRYGAGKPVRLELRGGEHVVTAGGPGLVSQQLTVRMEPGQTVRLPIQLARATAPPRPRAAPRPPAQEPAYSPPSLPAPAKPVEPVSTYRPAPAPAPAAAAPAAPRTAVGLPPP